MMLVLNWSKINLTLAVVFSLMFAALFVTNSVSAAPPDDECYLSASICESDVDLSIGTEDVCALCKDNGKDMLEPQIRDNPKYKLNLTPSAEILYPSDGDVFYVTNAEGYVDIPLSGRANSQYRMLTGGELKWVISDGVRYVYAYAQGESTYARVYHRSEGCTGLLAILDATVLHNIVAYDVVGITVCRATSTS